ncbi:hypothetical protein VE02_07122 [Pseudogymnoascus sp. 03VT05]|nr:hypothetical protein VE02_07122 [Pseudogymnoascus sp. 03VT05]
MSLLRYHSQVADFPMNKGISPQHTITTATMCNQLTTIYSCDHSKTTLKHCPLHDPEDAGAFTTPSTCRRMKESTKKRQCVCKACDARLVCESEEGERRGRREARDRERRLMKTKKECGVM